MSDDSSKAKELHIPPAVWDDPNSRELLRAWAANNKLHVSFRTDWRQAGAWGVFLGDVARHAARALASEDICTEQEALEQIRDVFERELGKPTDIGVTDVFRKN